jgi:hypothetical protein
MHQSIGSNIIAAIITTANGAINYYHFILYAFFNIGKKKPDATSGF